MLGRFETRGDIGIIFVDHPPVNAISVGVREAIIHGLSQGEGNATVKAVVIACEGRTFMAGADITEFGGAPKSPTFPDMFEALERFSKPLIAAIHGTAFGGGFEIALACDYRVATPTAQVGLPRSQARHPAGRGRNAAPAASGRGRGGAQHHRLGRSGAGAGGAQAGGSRQDHRGRSHRRRCRICARESGQWTQADRRGEDRFRFGASRLLRSRAPAARQGEAKPQCAPADRGRGGGGGEPAVRGRPQTRARADRPMFRQSASPGAPACLLCRAPSVEDPWPRCRRKASPSKVHRRHRRRHDGRRHRHELRQRGHSRDGSRSRKGGPRPWPRRGAQELRPDERAGRAAHGVDQADAFV
jgi:hypothetical protein